MGGCYGEVEAVNRAAKQVADYYILAGHRLCGDRALQKLPSDLRRF